MDNHELAVRIVNRILEGLSYSTWRENGSYGDLLKCSQDLVSSAEGVLNRYQPKSKGFLIGQRVVIQDEIGTVQRGPSFGDDVPPNKMRPGYVWVYLASRGYAREYDEGNVQPLPGGQF